MKVCSIPFGMPFLFRFKRTKKDIIKQLHEYPSVYYKEKIKNKDNIEL